MNMRLLRFASPALLTFLLGVPSLAISDEPVKASAAPALPDIPPPPDVAKPPADAAKTKSGLYSKVLEKGTGTVHPKPGDIVEVVYAGWMTDGKLFDTSKKRGAPAKFPLHRLIEGWQEGLTLMVVGEKRRLWIPADLAYGDTPLRPGGPHGMLVFDVELLGIVPDAVADQLPKGTQKKGKKSK